MITLDETANSTTIAMFTRERTDMMTIPQEWAADDTRLVPIQETEGLPMPDRNPIESGLRAKLNERPLRHADWQARDRRRHRIEGAFIAVALFAGVILIRYFFGG